MGGTKFKIMQRRGILVMSNNEKLIQALVQLKQSAREINELWYEADDETYSNLCEDYPFDNDLVEVVEKISDWVNKQEKLLKEVQQ
ncbi:hypothetical protein NSQ76_20320 [Bacillus sp. FSL M8-0256]|uniref:hypothetical protein n=1 Tax=Bacillus sp. FSL M8-0256 TaxID=2954578 RepID=UPI0030F7E12A